MGSFSPVAFIYAASSLHKHLEFVAGADRLPSERSRLPCELKDAGMAVQELQPLASRAWRLLFRECTPPALVLALSCAARSVFHLPLPRSEPCRMAQGQT